jgi:hypothetical protein
MKMTKQSGVFAAALLAAVVSASTVVGGTVSVVQTPNGGINDGILNLAGSVTNDIIIDSPGTTILSQQMRLVLDSGQVLNHTFGSNTPPNPALIGSFPSLAYDSFISAGTYHAGGPAPPLNPVPSVVGRSDALGGPGGVPALFSPTQWDVLWGPELGQNTMNATGYLSARITLSGDAQAAGSFDYLAFFGDGTEVRLHAPVVNGAIVIPPAGEPPLVGDVYHMTMALNEIVGPLMPMDTQGTAPVTWSGLQNPTYMPNFGAPMTALGINHQPTWDPLTQKFNWDTSGSSRGTYMWEVTATNDFGSDVGKITVDVKFIPEPASFVLAGLSLLGLVGLGGRQKG